MCNNGITQFYLSPTHEPYLPLLPSRKASPPFGWYSLWRDGQAELTWGGLVNYLVWYILFTNCYVLSILYIIFFVNDLLLTNQILNDHVMWHDGKPTSKTRGCCKNYIIWVHAPSTTVRWFGPPVKIERRKCAKSSLTQPPIVRFRSNLAKMLITWHLLYRRRSRSRSQRRNVVWSPNYRSLLGNHHHWI